MTSTTSNKHSFDFHKSEIIALFQRHPAKMTYWLCTYYPISEKILAKHQEKIVWSSISKNENITWTAELIARFQHKLDWFAISSNPKLPWSIDFIEQYKHKFQDFTELSNNTGIPWSYSLLEKYSSKWNWHWLAVNQSIDWTEKMMVDFDQFDQNLSRFNGNNLWTEAFILKYKARFHWGHLCYNPNLPWTEELIEELRTTWIPFERSAHFYAVSPWKGLSENIGLPWSKKFIKKYLPFPLIHPDGFNWKGLSRNESLPWKENLLEEFSSKWDWSLLSCNHQVGFTLEQLDTYKDKIVWEGSSSNVNTIAINSSLPWTEELIERYHDKWHWWGLAMNTGIVWTEALIDKYSDKLEAYPLFRNPSMPWSLDFLLKYETGCFDALTNEYGNVSERMWQGVFQNMLTDELVDELLSGSYEN